jgi:hypothetical protein
MGSAQRMSSSINCFAFLSISFLYQSLGRVTVTVKNPVIIRFYTLLLSRVLRNNSIGQWDEKGINPLDEKD